MNETRHDNVCVEHGSVVVPAFPMRDMEPANRLLLP